METEWIQNSESQKGEYYKTAKSKNGGIKNSKRYKTAKLQNVEFFFETPQFLPSHM